MRRHVDIDDDSYEFVPPRRRGFRWKWLMPIVLILAGLLWFAPAIALNTPLQGLLLAWLAPELRDSLTLGSVQAAWLRPLRVEDLTLLDGQHRKMLHLVRVESEKSLFQLLQNRWDLGRIQVVHPELYLVAREDGSNLEDFARQYLWIGRGRTFVRDGELSTAGQWRSAHDRR